MANSSDPVIEDISCPSNGIHLSQCSITIPTDSSICSVNDPVLAGTCTKCKYL